MKSLMKLGLLGPEPVARPAQPEQQQSQSVLMKLGLLGLQSATENVDVVVVPLDAVLAGHETTPPNYEALWKQYVTKFRKVYNDVDEETVWFRNFKLNVEKIRATRNDRDLTLHFGLNEPTDPTSQEFAAKDAPQKRISERTLEQIVEQNVVAPVQHVVKENLDVTNDVPQGRILEWTEAAQLTAQQTPKAVGVRF